MAYKNITLADSGNPPEEKDIIAFEQRLSTRLPKDYRQFLLESNGGQPEPNAFPIANNSNDTFGLIEYFFSISRYDPDYDLLDNLDAYQGRIPASLLPIASDPGGNLICLAIKGEYIGKIYFWDHNDERMLGKMPDYHNVYFVADSFDELIVNLTIYTE